MILNILLSILIVSAIGEQLPIRVGISQLNIGSNSRASYSIPFKKSLLSPSYNSLTSVSYINSFNTDNGIDITTNCTTNTQANMKCTLISTISNQFSVVYMSYVVSNYDFLQVGTFAKTFFFDSTGVDDQLVFKPNINIKYINTSNSNYVNFYPFITGISSLDDDFSLNIDKPRFDTLALSISMSISIREVHVRNVTIIFGYMIFDSSKITVSLFEGQSLNPGNIAKDYIYGIRNINSIKTPRLLQARPLPSLQSTTGKLLPSPQSTIAKPLPSLQSTIFAPVTVTDAVNIFPFVQTYPKNKTVFKGTQFTPQTPSYTAQLLKNGQISQLRFKNIYLNPKAFAAFAQEDGLIDVDSATLEYLRSQGLFSNGLIPFARMRKAVNKHHHKAQDGVDINLFNSLFGTNGFVIMSASNDIDQTYYYEVNLAQPFFDQQSRSAPLPKDPSSIAKRAPSSFLDPSAFYSQTSSQPIYYASTLTNKKPSLICSKGEVLVGIETLIDYIQKQMILKCVYCSPGTYVSPITKNCAPNPRIPNSPPATIPGKGAIRNNTG